VLALHVPGAHSVGDPPLQTFPPEDLVLFLPYPLAHLGAIPFLFFDAGALLLTQWHDG
jgi:hypothetical protein